MTLTLNMHIPSSTHLVLHLPIFRSQAAIAIVSEKNKLFLLFPIEKPKLRNLTLP